MKVYYEIILKPNRIVYMCGKDKNEIEFKVNFAKPVSIRRVSKEEVLRNCGQGLEIVKGVL